MKRLMIGFVLLVVSLAATNAFSAVQVVIDSGYLNVNAGDYVGSDAIQTITPSLPLSTTSTVADGSATSSVTYNFSNSGETAIFDISSMTQSFDIGDQYTQAYGHFNFTLSETVDYSIAGAFSGSGTDSGDEYVEHVYLYDFSASASVFEEYDNVISASASLALDGVVQGTGSANGSLTGTLEPGQYQFYYVDFAHDVDSDPAGSASASGHVNLTLSKVIPEPSTLIIWSLLGVTFLTVGYFRKRRQQAA